MTVDPLSAARRRAWIRLIPLAAVVGALSLVVVANLIVNTSSDPSPQALSPYSGSLPADRFAGSVNQNRTAATGADVSVGSTTGSSGSTTSTGDVLGSATERRDPRSPSTAGSTSSTDSTASPAADIPATTGAAAGTNKPSPVNTYGTTPARTPRSFDGRNFGDGAVAGTDVAAGRYWSSDCAGWQQFDGDRLVSRWSRHATQSLVDLRDGETLLSGCRWYAGNPTSSSVLPTGKLSTSTQLLPGRYRPVNEFCMTGPSDTRSTNAITSASESIAWESMPKDFVLVVTGSENWTAYGVTSECGGLVRVG